MADKIVAWQIDVDTNVQTVYFACTLLPRIWLTHAILNILPNKNYKFTLPVISQSFANTIITLRHS
jgi:hypothetical protein